MQTNQHDDRYDTPEQPTPDTPEPLEEEARREEALTGGRHDLHEGPGPVYSPEGAADADGPVDITRTPAAHESFDQEDARDDVLAPDQIYDDRTAQPTGTADTLLVSGTPTDVEHDITTDVQHETITGVEHDITGVEHDTITGSATGVEPGIDLEQRWHEVKAGFVDDPRQSVEQADSLVEEALAAFTTRRQTLLDQWKNSDQTDTEALRLALREYHALLLQLTGK